MTNRVLITSALPYVSATKHLGNLCGSLLPADVHARFRRQLGHEVLFLCGTDDHGTPAELAAEAAQTPIAEFVANQHQTHQALYQRYNLSFDYFGQTSSARNHELTRTIILALFENGLIEERTDHRLWSDIDKRFLPDRYVTGQCPYCGYAKARGDQCDACTRLLDPEELIAPRSTLSGDRNLVLKDTRHLYLRQDLLSDRLRRWLEERDASWPKIATAIARKWLDDGLEARCISRDLDWGVKIPLDGFEDKVAYVWFDAPIGYAAIGLEWQDACPETRNAATWWEAAADGEYIQFLGKDSIPFHTVTFPATILGAEADLRTVDRLKAFNWLTFNREKFSTSENRGVFLDDALDILPADVWRWWLTAHAPENDDAHFSFDQLRTDTNADLSGLFGNLVNRVLTYAFAKTNGLVPPPGVPPLTLDSAIKARLGAIKQYHLDLEFRKAAAETRALWSNCNAWVVNTAPWEKGIAETDRQSRISIALGLVGTCALAALPIIPATASRVLDSLGVNDRQWPTELKTPAGGSAFTVPPLAFSKISDEDVSRWRDRFGGG